MDGQGGVKLRAALFPLTGARGSVVLSPGRAEAIEKYYEVIEALRARGFAVLAHDWRGQGLSQRLTGDPLRGHASGCDAYMEDFRRVLDAFEARLPRPWLAIGHSMGGALTALAVVEGELRLAAAALSAPMFGLQLGGTPPWLARPVAWTMGRLGRSTAFVAGPGDPLGGRFEANILTHDRARWERAHALLAAHPALRVGSVTWGWLAFALEVSARLARAPKGAVGIPLTIVLAGQERLVDNAAARAFAARHGVARVDVKTALHEILVETDDRAAVFWSAFDRLAGTALALPPEGEDQVTPPPVSAPPGLR